MRSADGTLGALQRVQLTTKIRHRRDSAAIETRTKYWRQKYCHPHGSNDEENKLAHLLKYTLIREHELLTVALPMLAAWASSVLRRFDKPSNQYLGLRLFGTKSVPKMAEFGQKVAKMTKNRKIPYRR